MNNSPLTLAIETSGRTGSVAIGRDGAVIAQQPFSGLIRHSAELFPSIESLLGHAGATAADIGQVCITVGPGSFTGLRIAVTAAKMFHLALNTELIALDSLDVTAENASRYMQAFGQDLNCIAVVLDAKKDYFYAAAYRRCGSDWVKSQDTRMLTTEQILDELRLLNTRVFMLGEALVYHKSRFEAAFISFLDPAYWPPQAANMFRLAALKSDSSVFADPIALTPLYIRKPDVVVKSRD
ncbi:MAG: tRNA (adenosine(37)-N6)-threonylcarbamoyltransferase complex dimerization subunit type 1 TsaB [Planctomycetaceae bacterium]|nr:tRNA (adenosine(37)-N6)-threonylcarbamoyltransferase complex dimerization subunit type 1 TsaB [Planctomycetaceae bacterium]